MDVRHKLKGTAADPQELLRLWCRAGDVDALGALFDVAAPQLLRVALHVARDPSHAEDLVQSAFLAAIERREAIDPTQPALAWLTAVVRRRAIDARRRAGAVELQDTAHERVASADEAVDAQLAHAELSAEVTRAIDRLSAPLREVVLLRLRHGATPAEIAHLLGRAPGTVRVQLHRGLEELRRSLPAGIAGALLVGSQFDRLGGASRGLDAVRAGVMREAQLASSLAAASTPSIGTLFMGQKTLLVGAAAIVAAASLAFLPRDIEPTNVEPAPAVSPGSAVGVASLEERLAEPETDRAPLVARAEATAADAAGPLIRGRVLDAVTGLAVTNAAVAAYPVARGTLQELAAVFDGVFEAMSNGGLRGRGFVPFAALEGTSDAARFGHGTIAIPGLVAPDSEAVASAVTDVDGRFDMKAGGASTLMVAAAGYATRSFSLEHNAGGTLELWPARHYAGRIVTPDGEPCALDLAVSAVSWEELEDGSRVPAELQGTWRVPVAEDGTFSFEAGGSALHAASLTPGWFVLGGALEPGVENRLLVDHRPCFHFVDAASSTPVQRVNLAGRWSDAGFYSIAGEFSCPGGLLPIPGIGLAPRAVLDRDAKFVAWTDEHDISEIDVSSSALTRSIEVRLLRGSPPIARGIVYDGGRACSGLGVALIATGHSYWRRDEGLAFDATETDASGGFQLQGPPGPSAVRVTVEDQTYVVPVLLPQEAPLDIDLAEFATLEVVVVREGGGPSPDHVVSLRTSTKFSERGYANEEGRVLFEALPPGDVMLLVPHVSTRTSFSADITEELTLARGERRTVQLVVPDLTGERYLAVTDGRTTDYSRWSAHVGVESASLERSGLVPIELSVTGFDMLIRSDDGRHWRFLIPKGAPDGTVVNLTRGDGSYRGQVTDEDGEPIGRVAVFLRQAGDEPKLSTQSIGLTDADGRFRVDGLDRSAKSWIELRRLQPGHPVGYSRASSPMEKAVFDVSVLPEDDTPIHVVVPRSDGQLGIAGRVHGPDGVPLTLANFSVSAYATLGDADVRVASVFGQLDPDGTFDASVPRSDRVEIRVHSWEANEVLADRSIDVRGRIQLPEIILDVP